MPFTLSINGQSRDLANLTQPVSLDQVIAELNLKGDRVAVEHNGSIVQRAQWPLTAVAPCDRLEVVHFVGGGAGDGSRRTPQGSLKIPHLRPQPSRLYIISVIGRYI
jgi:sulfur carrier protein